MRLIYKWTKAEVKKIARARDVALARVKAVGHDDFVEKKLCEGGVMHLFNVLMEKEQ